jgi:hypothetical protein
MQIVNEDMDGTMGEEAVWIEKNEGQGRLE